MLPPVADQTRACHRASALLSLAGLQSPRRQLPGQRVRTTTPAPPRRATTASILTLLLVSHQFTRGRIRIPQDRQSTVTVVAFIVGLLGALASLVVAFFSSNTEPEATHYYPPDISITIPTPLSPPLPALPAPPVHPEPPPLPSAPPAPSVPPQPSAQPLPSQTNVGNLAVSSSNAYVWFDQTVALGGVTYTNALVIGSGPPSQITFFLGGHYSIMELVVGLSDQSSASQRYDLSISLDGRVIERAAGSLGQTQKIFIDLQRAQRITFSSTFYSPLSRPELALIGKAIK
jgi:hypothetical protein